MPAYYNGETMIVDLEQPDPGALRQFTVIPRVSLNVGTTVTADSFEGAREKAILFLESELRKLKGERRCGDRRKGHRR